MLKEGSLILFDKAERKGSPLLCEVREIKNGYQYYWVLNGAWGLKASLYQQEAGVYVGTFADQRPDLKDDFKLKIVSVASDQMSAAYYGGSFDYGTAIQVGYDNSVTKPLKTKGRSTKADDLAELSKEELIQMLLSKKDDPSFLGKALGTLGFGAAATVAVAKNKDVEVSRRSFLLPLGGKEC